MLGSSFRSINRMKKIVVMGRDGNGEGHIELLCNFDTKH